MYKIKVYRNTGKSDELVVTPDRTFSNFAEIEDWLDANHPGCWYSTEMT